jgi:hypothetical protein
VRRDRVLSAMLPLVRPRGDDIVPPAGDRGRR